MIIQKIILAKSTDSNQGLLQKKLHGSIWRMNIFSISTKYFSARTELTPIPRDSREYSQIFNRFSSEFMYQPAVRAVLRAYLNQM
jgi:hypothetical protein